MTMYAIYDDFNRKIISRHRTVKNAAKAKERFVSQFQRHNSANGYLPVILVRVDSAGEVSHATEDDHSDFGMLLDRH
jgi:hypothetical protein